MKDSEIVRALKALADPTRFRMVQAIAAAGELTCGACVETFGLAQPTISHHLKALVDSGVVVVRAEGKHHFFSVNHALIGGLGGLLSTRLAPSASAPRKSGQPRSR